MIESRYWRSELKSDIRWLRAHRKYKRWSEKQTVLFERKLMLVAFQVRSLLDRPKVNDQFSSLMIAASSFPKIGDKPFTYVGSGHLEDRFDLDRPKATQLPVMLVCNQFVHFYYMSLFSDIKGMFTSVLLFSDYKRHTCAYSIQILNLINLFAAFSDDESAVCGCDFVWDAKKQDFVMKNARAPREAGRAVRLLE